MPRSVVRSTSLLLAFGLGMLVSAPMARAQAATVSLRISRSAYPVPERAPNVIVHRPAAFDVHRPYDLVFVLHGWNTCIESFVREGRVPCHPGGPVEQGWGLAARFDAVGVNALMIVPQIAYRSRVGHAGDFNRPDFARLVAEEALAQVAEQTGGATADGARRVVVVAHSAGFETAFAMSRRSGFGEKLIRIALMDALYDVPEFFGRWVRDDDRRSLVSLHIGGRPEVNAARLLTYARRALPRETVAVNPPASDLERAIATHRLVVARIRGDHTHALLDHLAEVVRP